MQYAYDIKGQLLKVTDPLGRVNFEHKYDTAGNNLWTKHLDSGVRTVVVDAQGKPLYSNDAKGARTYTSYDRLNRPTGVWARDKAVEPFTKRQALIYGDQSDVWPREERNLWGRLYQHYDEAGKVQVEGYDFKGNPLVESRRVIKDELLAGAYKYVVDWGPLDEAILDPKTFATDRDYDALNRVRGIRYPENAEQLRTEVEPQYNRAGALQGILVDFVPYVNHIAYNAKGQRLLMALGNGVMTRYAYDPLTFRLQRIRSEKFNQSGNTYTATGGVQQDLGYHYDLGGNIIGIRDKAPANHSAEGPGDLLKKFSYDPLKRLLTATGRESSAPSALPLWDAGVRAHDYTATNTYTRAYTYDKMGNVLQEQHTADGHAANSFTKLFHYHPAGDNNRLVSYEVGTYTFPLEYDANGNSVKEFGAMYYQWDHADRLKLYMVQGGGGPPSKWAHYLYDAAGTRIKKVVNKPGGIQEVTTYINGIFEETYVQTGGVIDSNRHYNTLHVMDGRSRIATIRVGTDMEDPTPAVKYNLEDHLGTSSVMVDFNGNLINREEYYPFGETSFGAFAKKRYRYVGKEKDNESGLYYYGARYYAAWTCRFISVDPLAGQYAHLNPYNYAGNKPIGDLDIDGMQGTGETPAHSGASSIGNAEFNEKAQAALKSNPTTTELEFSTDGVNSYGSITTDGNTVCYDSNVGFTDPAGNVLQKANTKGGLIIPQRDAEGLLVLSKNPPSSNASNAGSGASATEAIGGIQGPETKEQADRRESLTMLAEAVDYAYFGRSSKPASDDTVESDQLFYQWVHGTGPDTRTFRQGSNMANWMLGADYVQAAMRSAAGKAMKGNLGTTQFMHSARETNEYWYPFEFAGDALTNPARAFHGSITGSVTTYGIVDSNGKKGVVMRIQMSDNMTAISGTRARPSEGGYAPNQPNAVYPQENPYGPNGQFRTIHIRYDINIHYFPN